MGKFFPNLTHEAEDLAGAVANLQNGDRVVNIHFNVIMYGGIDKAKIAASQFLLTYAKKWLVFCPL